MGLRPSHSSVQIKPFLVTDSLLCTGLHSTLQVRLSFPLGCPLILWLIPNSSVSCGQVGHFCCSQLLLFTQMNFSYFPTRACEWVAWAFFFSPLFFLVLRWGIWLFCGTGDERCSYFVPFVFDCFSFFFFPASLVWWGLTHSVWRFLFLRAWAWVCPTLVMKSWYVGPSPGLETSLRKVGLNSGLWSWSCPVFSPATLVQTQICYAKQSFPGSVLVGYIVQQLHKM